MHKLTMAALGSVLILTACGGGGDGPVATKSTDGFRQDRTHHVGYASVMPRDISRYTLVASDRGLDGYAGWRRLDDGIWRDWYVDITAVDGAAYGVAFDPTGSVWPWAIGPLPERGLAASSTLSGTVSWAGGLAGIGTNGITVIGLADMTVDLGTMNGQLDFTQMQYWTDPADFAPGTGTRWGGGELEYTIVVTGNVFADTGGDEGTVTGAFFGREHEAMGGTLERNDLVGAFGGSR